MRRWLQQEGPPGYRGDLLVTGGPEPRAGAGGMRPYQDTAQSGHTYRIQHSLQSAHSRHPNS